MADQEIGLVDDNPRAPYELATPCKKILGNRGFVPRPESWVPCYSMGLLGRFLIWGTRNSQKKMCSDVTVKKNDGYSFFTRN